MGRSIKKGPFVDTSLRNRIEEMNRRFEKKVVKSWSRRSTIVASIAPSWCPRPPRSSVLLTFHVLPSSSEE